MLILPHSDMLDQENKVSLLRLCYLCLIMFITVYSSSIIATAAIL